MAAVKRRILIECGAGETRAALVFDDEPVRFWFGPARGDEALPRPAQTGDIILGRVRTISKPLRAAFVDIGEAQEGFLPLGAAEEAVEGAPVIVRVKRPAVGAKGAALSADWARDLGRGAAKALEEKSADASAPARLGALRDASMQAFMQIRPPGFEGQVFVNDVAAAQILHAQGVEILADDDRLFERCGVDETIDAALERTAALPGGAHLVIDETEGLTVVDVDAGAAADSATGHLNDKVNMAAAKALFGELSRRGIGGRIVVDFLPPSGPAARKALLGALERAREGLFSARFGRLSADGLFDMTAPRAALSLLELATEPVGAGLARTGRRFTLDWAGKTAIRALERALAVRPQARPRLLVGAALEDYLCEARPQWRERLAARHGARFEIRADDRLEERSFELVE
ncbi:ribonuclease E/G [Amphiplicatus metriothermophilus]|uniref:Ribonuclease, Rne/Rng family n=1 Tax=Amphiplicatus metriothermophilus TaxID=1519374 RepID=A0A239PSW1_9PROT|nr:ribonuclease E/G [Amphiplicatus metriothermophilus]MBB5519286.1 Ribonuclease G/E [Amphiplicatus metriothermophilus]SNT73355.1 ribonuclease, Rne/Rng family [Amphiplicatus metriothermophilus]